MRRVSLSSLNLAKNSRSSPPISWMDRHLPQWLFLAVPFSFAAPVISIDCSNNPVGVRSAAFPGKFVQSAMARQRTNERQDKSQACDKVCPGTRLDMLY